MSRFIAVDIGGTQIRAACYPPDTLKPDVIDRISTRHPSITPLERLVSLVHSIWPEDGDIAAIGVAAAGPVNPYEGVIIEAPNIPGWKNVHLREHLENIFHVPVVVGNDANLAAMGEWKFGAGQGFHHLIYITVSTGIGGGIIIDDQLLLGQKGLGGEIGHITVIPDGPMCGCGHRGHLEAVASGPAIAHWVQQEIQRGVSSSLPADQPLTAKIIGAAAQEGDELAIAGFGRAGNFLGEAIANFLHIFNPSAIIIGGGVSQAGPLLMEPIWATMEKRVLSPAYLEDLTLTTAALGDEVGLAGAAALAQTALLR